MCRVDERLSQAPGGDRTAGVNSVVGATPDQWTRRTIIDAIRRGMLRAADQLTMAGLHAGKFFGFLSSGSDLVEIYESASGPGARFADLADEGWPGFSVPIPPGAEFRYAASGPLSRVALWESVQPEQQILDYFGRREGGMQFSPNAEGAAEAKLPNGVSVHIRSIGNGTTLFIVKQVREPDAIKVVIRDRAAKRKGSG